MEDTVSFEIVNERNKLPIKRQESNKGHVPCVNIINISENVNKLLTEGETYLS